MGRACVDAGGPFTVPVCHLHGDQLSVALKGALKADFHVKDLRADAVVTESAAESPRLLEGVKSSVRVLLVPLSVDGFC